MLPNRVQQILKGLISEKNEAVLTERAAYGYALLRSGHFTLQQLSLPWVEFLLTGKKPPTASEYKEKYSEILPVLNELLKEDAKNIADKHYPVEVLKPENFVKHSLRYPQILKDGYSITKRRDEKKVHDFSPEAQDFAADLPDYYKRNFHFQTDGYLSKDSAELYEHQVEILFAGAADAMRRSVIPEIKKLKALSEDGEGLRFLEVGAGTGRLTRFMKLAFPKANIVVLDISQPYISVAAERLKDFDGIECDVGLGEKLNHPDQSFDLVYSCFLFHELPREIRQQVLSEGFRVLKPGGVYALVDSLQLNDESFEWALERFPQDFHEPFYRNYTQMPMEDLLTEVGFQGVQSKKSFLSKAVVAQKSK